MSINPLILPDLREMLVEKDDASLAEITRDLHPAMLAEITEGLSVEETWQLLDHAELHHEAEIFAFLPVERQVEQVSGIGRERMSKLIDAMPHDTRVELIRQLNPEIVEELLPLVTKADREDIKRLLSYPPHSAGAVMTTDYATLPPNISVTDAIAEVRHQAPTRETIYYLYVLDSDRKLIGSVSLRNLIVAKPTALVSDIMEREIVSISIDADQDEAARELAKYDFLAIPVVDHDNRLVGIVTHDDVIDVVVEEATDEAQRMASVVPLGEDYMALPILTVWKKRSVWLACLFVAELFTFSALAHFEDEFSKIIALSLFVPLCISTGGNSGSQAATLITRAMALGQIGPHDWFRVIRHELVMGIILGLTLGVIGFFRAAATPTSVLSGADRWLLAFVIAQAVAVICLWGTLVGSVLPMIFRRLGFDPAYASSPFVATFVDVTGIVIYFTIAKIYLL
ncbi:MAG TPA: magnesium transporter [Pirellulaceae bacterium]|jgi:magnesium transporter